MNTTSSSSADDTSTAQSQTNTNTNTNTTGVTDDLVQFLEGIGVTSRLYQSDVEPSPRDRVLSNPSAQPPSSSTNGTSAAIPIQAPTQSSNLIDQGASESGRKPRRRRTIHQQNKGNEKDTAAEAEAFLKWLDSDPKPNQKPPQSLSLQTTFTEEHDSTNQSPTVASDEVHE